MDTSLTSIWRTSSGNIWKHNRHEVSIPLWTFDDLRSSFIVGTHDGPGTAALCKTHGGFPAAAGVDLAVAFVASCRHPGKQWKQKLTSLDIRFIRCDIRWNWDDCDGFIGFWLIVWSTGSRWNMWQCRALKWCWTCKITGARGVAGGKSPWISLDHLSLRIQQDLTL